MASLRLSSARISLVALLLAVLLLAVAVIPLHRWALATGQVSVEEKTWFLPPPTALKVASIGFHGMAADLVWLLTIQYFGTHFETDHQFPELRRLLDTVAALDPHFVDAYSLGGLFLIYFARDILGGIAFLEQGARVNPMRWELPYEIARTYYLDLKDYRQALRWFEVTDRIPGRPQYVPRFIARLYAAAGEAETAIELWRAMLESTTNEWVRSLATREIARLEAQRKARPSEKPR